MDERRTAWVVRRSVVICFLTLDQRAHGTTIISSIDGGLAVRSSITAKESVDWLMSGCSEVRVERCLNDLGAGHDHLASYRERSVVTANR